MLQQFLAVFLVLALLLAALWLVRRKGLAGMSLAGMSLNLARPSARKRRMQVVERVPLTAQHSLHLVSVSGRMIVVGVSPGGCSRLASWPSDAQPEEGLLP
jgi:flagellar biogenesis protein FliO